MDINKVIAIVRRLNESPSIIRAGSRKKSSYRGPTGDHSRDKEGNIKASFYKKKSAPQGEKSGEHIPVLNWKGKENKSARYGSQLHRLRPRSERLGKKKVSEGRSFADWKKAAASVLKKKEQERKPQKAQDAGARARRVLKRREYQSKVSAIVPAELEDQKVWDRIKKIW